jgi:hypothetical protein
MADDVVRSVARRLIDASTANETVPNVAAWVADFDMGSQDYSTLRSLFLTSTDTGL